MPKPKFDYGTEGKNTEFQDDDLIESLEYDAKEPLPMYQQRPFLRRFQIVVPNMYRNIHQEQYMLGIQKERLFAKLIFVGIILFLFALWF